MPFYKKIIIGMLACSTVVIAQEAERMSPEQALEKANAQGWLKGVSKENEMRKAQKYVPELEKITGKQSEIIVERSREYFNSLDVENEQDIPADKREMDESQIKVPLDVYISASIPDGQLKKIFVMASQMGARLLIRGVDPKTSSIMTTLAKFKRIAQGIHPEPHIELNPVKFKENRIKVVPTMIYKERGHTFRVKGTASGDWLIARAQERNESEDFGVMGKLFDIEEKNLIDLARERNDAIDWKKEQQKAINRFWTNHHFEELPEIQKDKTFYLDPTIKVTQDILNQGGDVIAYKGQVVNPAENMPYQLKVMVFDATKELQVLWALDQVEKWKDHKIVIVSTSFDRADGWKHLQKIRTRFGREVKLLNAAMVNSFKLVSVPSTIQTVDGYLKIDQIGLDTLKEKFEKEGE